MVNKIKEQDSSSNPDVLNNPTHLIKVCDQISIPFADEFDTQIINKCKEELEGALILKEQQISCLNRELFSEKIVNLDSGTTKLDSDLISSESKSFLDVGASGIISNSNLETEFIASRNDVLVPRKIESHEGFDFPMGKQNFIDSCLKKSDDLKIRNQIHKEKKDSKYYVSPLRPKPDFSIHGDFAEIMELGYAKEVEEYNEKVLAMKKLKDEDERLEKIRKENAKNEAARQRAIKKIEKTIKKLQSQVFKFGHYSEVVGYNDSQSLIKLGIPRTYHRLVDKRGYIIKTAPFIEVSQTRDAFYCYNSRLDRYELYVNYGKETDNKYILIKVTKTQQEMWDSFKAAGPHNCGFTFIKYESFDKAMYY